jgi:hypothetical protein
LNAVRGSACFATGKRRGDNETCRSRVAPSHFHPTFASHLRLDRQMQAPARSEALTGPEEKFGSVTCVICQKEGWRELVTNDEIGGFGARGRCFFFVFKSSVIRGERGNPMRDIPWVEVKVQDQDCLPPRISNHLSLKIYVFGGPTAKMSACQSAEAP